MHYQQDTAQEELSDLTEAVTLERQREVAVEHLLFQTVLYVERQHPGLLDHLERSLSHLGDSADDETKNHETVLEIARLFIGSLRRIDQ